MTTRFYYKRIVSKIHRPIVSKYLHKALRLLNHIEGHLRATRRRLFTRIMFCAIFKVLTVEMWKLWIGWIDCIIRKLRVERKFRCVTKHKHGFRIILCLKFWMKIIKISEAADIILMKLIDHSGIIWNELRMDNVYIIQLFS